MCLLLFAYNKHPDYQLILAANRDEFHARPTQTAHWWTDAPDIFAGRDLEKSGTWMGVNKNGKFAALTNFRDPSQRKANAPSRGLLVSNYLHGILSPADYLAQLAQSADQYEAFNLFLGDKHSLWFFSSRDEIPHELKPGVYGLSNATLDEPWPKVTHGKQGLTKILVENINENNLFSLLADRTVYHDEHLPQTGVPLEWERRLSASFIVSPEYGTRCSTLLLIGKDGRMEFVERSFDAAGEITGTKRAGFTAC
ncbi:MAG: NRDE family protein [Burkholderiales bacterium]